MYSKRDLLTHLAEIGVDPRGTLLVHSSLKAVGATENRADTVVDALVEYMTGGLLVLPAHTWSNVGTTNPVMDVLHTPTCVGALTELFRRRSGVRRSLHPTHSLAALGAGAEAFVAGEERVGTPCGAGGAYHRLWERDAQILLVGVTFARNTFIHGIEEWDGAVGTISSEPTDLYVITEDGCRLHTPQHRHYARLGSETFPKLEPQAIHEGVLTLGRLGDATTRLMRAQPLRAMVAARLAEDPTYLLRH